MSEAASAQHAEEIRRILLNRHLDAVFSSAGPRRPGSAPPQAEVLPGSPCGPPPGSNINIITGEPFGRAETELKPAPAPAVTHAKAPDSGGLGLTPEAEEA